MSAEFPFPDVEWEPTRPFFTAARRSELAIPQCSACGHWNWYPPERCRACDAAELAWTPVSGRGTLFTWAVVERAWVKPFDSIAPYVSALVALDEDPSVRIVSYVVDADPHTLRVDMPVAPVFRPLPLPDAPAGLLVPLFTAAAPGGAPRRSP